jgi:hypothetical protein
MVTRIKKYQEKSSLESLILRDRLGLSRYRNQNEREENKRKILLDLALKKMQSKEKEDYISLGFRRRKIRIKPPFKKD